MFRPQLPAGAAGYQLYFPSGYDSLCKFAAIHLPQIAKEIKKETGLATRKTPAIVIYPSLQQLYESNIGFHETGQQTFPTIVLKGDRVMIAFTGNYETFELQLKEAWLRLCWEELFSNDLEEQLTGRSPLAPSWFKEGCIGYLAGGWTLQDEAGLHETMQLYNPAGWEELLQSDSAMAGKAFCYFLSIQYRGDAMLQLLFRFKQRKSLSRAARLIFKRRLEVLQHEGFVFYQKRYQNLSTAKGVYSDREVIGDHLRTDEKLVAVYPNLSQGLKAFVTERAGSRTLFVTNDSDTGLKDKKEITGYLLPLWQISVQKDHYPLVSWSRDRKSLFVIRPVKGIITVQQFTATGSKTKEEKLYGVDGVGSFFELSERQWLMAAWRNGRSDIVSYDVPSGKYQPVTDDKADNYLLQLPGGEDAITYRSGYPADTFTADSLQKPYGIYQSHNRKERLLHEDSRYEKYFRQDQNDAAIYTQWIAEQEAVERTRDSIGRLEQELKANDINVLGNVLDQAAGPPPATGQEAGVGYVQSNIEPYRLQLFRSWYTARINNDYFINRLQPYRGYLGTFKFPEVGAMMASGFSDLFENYHFNIGYKLPAGTEGSDFFVRFENTRRTMDWHLMYFRKVESLQSDAVGSWVNEKGDPYPTQAKVKTLYFEAGVYFPLSYRWGLDITSAFRRGRTVFLSVNKYSLDFDDLKEWWNINTITFSGQRMQATLPLLYKGWKLKTYADILASYGNQSRLIYSLNAQGEYHQPLVKNITLVARAKAGYSGGDAHVLYNFGGTDNNIVPRVDTSVHFGQQSPYAFQQLVGGLRGYRQNSLYGNAYGMLLADIYFPVFQTLVPLRTGFSSLKNLQAGLFSDVAYGRETWQPGATWRHQVSYGFSLRTLLAGYPIRFDMGWPGRFDRSPVWYLSLNF